MQSFISNSIESLDFTSQHVPLLHQLPNKRKKKKYARQRGTQFGGFVSLVSLIIITLPVINYLLGWRSVDGETVSSKKIIVDFDSKETSETDI